MGQSVTVLTGVAQLLSVEEQYLKGKRLGLLTNPTGVDASFRSTIDICADLKHADLVALFACEHGIRGDKPAGIKFPDEVDEKLNIPIYSLYGEHFKPTEAMLAHIDALIFDIQDLGIRFYTYLSSLVYVMEACATYGKEVIVLDRPNPLGGLRFEGGILESGYESIVGASNIPFSTGLTIGEFARFINDDMNIGCELQVIPLKHWDRTMLYSETGLPWILPSPNIPTVDSALVYAGTCLFEGTNLSEGRGTTKPFELIGAPWLDRESVCRVMNGLQLPGVYFNPWTYKPTASKHQDELCHGVQLFITHRDTFQPVATGLYLLHHIMRLHDKHFEWLLPDNEDRIPFIDLLSGSELVRSKIHDPDGLNDILAHYAADRSRWASMRKRYLLY